MVTAKELSPQELEHLHHQAQAILRKANDWGEGLEELLGRLLTPKPAEPGLPLCAPSSEPGPAPSDSAPSASTP